MILQILVREIGNFNYYSNTNGACCMKFETSEKLDEFTAARL